MLSTTLQNFAYPQNLIKSYTHWHLLLRPKQPTLGSLVLICKEHVHNYADISAAAMSEQKKIIGEIESILKHRFDYSKMNYLMLMMVDPAVHFHIIPRYENPAEFCDREYIDKTWPEAPDLSLDLKLSDVYQQELLKTLITDFSGYPSAPAVAEKKYKRMFTSGSFDIFHQGHLNIIKKSKELCEYLIVGVSTDEVILKAKGRLPIIPFAERISILEANRYIDEVIPQVDKNKQKIVDAHNIDAISVGSDWRGKYPSVTCNMVYFDYTPNVSSTVLKQKLNITPKK
jgi:glycerol-3-phosphate cytidylyltransferase